MRKYLLSCIIFAVVLIIANTTSFTGTDELRSVMNEFTNGLVKAMRESVEKDAPQAQRRHTAPAR